MRKLLLLLAALVGGTLFVMAPSAGATPLPASGAMVPASGSPPKAAVLVSVRTPALPRVTVASGDTLWALGIRYHRGWSALAAYNHVPNPNLIFVGQVLTIPPASYTGSAPLPVSTPVHVKYAYAPTKQQVSTPVSHTSTYHVPQYGGASGSYQSCVATRESGNGSGSSNIYGFLQGTWSSLGLSGSPGSASRATQDAAFQQLYARDGRQPWSPYDGC